MIPSSILVSSPANPLSGSSSNASYVTLSVTKSAESPKIKSLDWTHTLIGLFLITNKTFDNSSCPINSSFSS